MTNSNTSENQSKDLQTSFSARGHRKGDIVTGSIVKITDSVAFLDYGARSEGYIRLTELKDQAGELLVSEGDTVNAVIVSAQGAVELSYKAAQANQALAELGASWKSQSPVEGKITGVNKGGYEVRIDGARAFCPASQLAFGFIDEPAREVGKTYEFLVTEFDGGKSIVVSRKLLLENRKKEAQSVMSDRLKVGDRLQGKVTEIRDFGAFVDLGDSIEGMVHVSEISHQRVNHPNEKLNVGEAIDVEVIRIDINKAQVALSMRRLEADPWADFAQKHEIGESIGGLVSSLETFGAFVTLAPGVEGLLHVSAISAEKRLNHPSDVLEAGQDIDVIIEKIDRDRRRISLVTPEVAEKRKPVEITVKQGQIVKGPVVRVERFGVFIEVEPNVQGVIPNAEMNTQRGADHRRLFPIGTELEAKIVELDQKRGRIRLSRRALEEHDEQEALAEYAKSQETPGSLGSFGDLLKDFLKNE
ncbi:MAG: S1 RNA-binding domain-containing protein [Myxococcota bacterium]|nr:S1 RNA-binding domain-containing protein [Myxococcota bacterium]